MKHTYIALPEYTSGVYGLNSTMSATTAPPPPPPEKPAIIIVWHVPAHYRTLQQGLQSAGYEVHCPLLPTCSAEQRPAADMYTDARAPCGTRSQRWAAGKSACCAIPTAGRSGPRPRKVS